MKRIFILLGMLFSIQTVFSQNIVKAEYFIDADLGQGNGITVPNLIAGETINFPIIIPTTQLSSGFHFLNVRVADVNGIWSRYETRAFYLSTTATTSTTNIVEAEYFIDSDPGVGGATQVTIGSSGAIVSFPVSVSIPMQLSPGFHFLSIRVKDQEGKWSLFEQRGFYVAPNPVDAPPIVAAEYFYDTDPGMGNASSLIVDPTGDIITQTFLIPVPGSLSQGDHVLSIRVRDQQGHWSFLAKDTITVGAPAGSITCPGNVTIDPFTNNCKAVVNNINAVGLMEDDSSYTYTLTGATTGNGIGTASGQLFNAGVTTVTYSLINSPTVSCSFTVTVNSSVTPTANISIPYTILCEGTLATFVCTSTGSGFNTAWQWKKNGISVGTNSNIYQDSTLENSDTITVAVTSSISCAIPQIVISAPVVMTVNETVTPSVSIIASATSICPGQQITFTATPTNGGSQPIYEWMKNGSFVGAGTVYQTSALANGDSVYVMLHNTTDCVTNTPVKSNVIHITITQAGTASVTISSSASTICVGQSVTFTATPVNGGNNPVYEWTLNNNAVGSNSPVYQTPALANGDKIRVTMSPSQSCGNNTPVVSNTITMTVGADVTPSVTMSAVNSTACTGTLAIFYASPISGAGSSPSYQWKCNGLTIPGATNSTYQSSSLQNGDVIRVEMTSSLSCANPQTVLSHDSVTMILSSVPLVPSVTISSSATSICQGQTVTFTALPTNGGDVPGYQWKLNGLNIGDNIDTFSTNLLQHGDKITVEMFTSVPCATSQTATSAPMTMTVTTVTTFYADFDGDGYGNGASGVAQACTAPAGYVSSNSDCNDDNASVHPGATEMCGNGIDDDCDGQTDETCGSPDNDGDGYTIAQGDCNDNNTSIHPGATEICGNGVDDNCNGQTDENCTESLPTLMTRTYPAKEGDLGFTILNVEVSLDTAAQLPVSVKYKTINEDAIAGTDYEFTSGTLVIPAGKISGSLQVRIIGDLLRESNERFKINFSDPVNVLLPAEPDSRVMIIDNDKGNPNNATTRAEQAPIKEESWKIPNVVRRNQVWMIPQIGNYENEVLIMNIQGQIINRFINYRNQTSLGNVSVGLYFYRIRIMENPGRYQYYSGRLLITE